MTIMLKEGYISTAQAAEHLGVSTRTLERWRGQGVGPPSYILPTNARGRRPVRYKAEEVRRWPAAGGGRGLNGMRAWVVEDGKMCGEAARLIEPGKFMEAMLERDDIEVMSLAEAIQQPWRSLDDLVPYVGEVESLAEEIVAIAHATRSHVMMQANTPR